MYFRHKSVLERKGVLNSKMQISDSDNGSGHEILSLLSFNIHSVVPLVIYSLFK